MGDEPRVLVRRAVRGEDTEDIVPLVGGRRARPHLRRPDAGEGVRLVGHQEDRHQPDPGDHQRPRGAEKNEAAAAASNPAAPQTQAGSAVKAANMSGWRW